MLARNSDYKKIMLFKIILNVYRYGKLKKKQKQNDDLTKIVILS